MKECVVVGCGLTGAVVARELAERNFKVYIIERRNHIGGNMYDYVDRYGILVHKYGPHTFHTNDESLYRYILKFAEWEPYRLLCGAEIDGKITPTPFNFKTIDDFYDEEKAKKLKTRLLEVFKNRRTVTVLEVLNCKDELIQEYGNFLFSKDYCLYTAKQWGKQPNEIDPSILERVPLRLDYTEGYFDDRFQVMPKKSYTDFFSKLLDHKNIEIFLNVDACSKIKVDSQLGLISVQGIGSNIPVVYTGALDELFGEEDGVLPYRSLRFEWHHEDICSKQKYPVVAYPQAEGFTRKVEFNKLPYQQTKGTTYEVEYPLSYVKGENEPYYPILTEESKKAYLIYQKKASKVLNLFCCGRLADFRYYNMDQALKRALEVAAIVNKRYP